MSTLPVVVGWDGSAGSRAAVKWAARQAGSQHRPLLLALAVYVPEPALGVFPSPAAPIYDDVEIADLLAPARELALEVSPGLAVDTVTLHGHPVAELTRLSESAAMMVIGSRGRGAFMSHLIGSTSVAVASHSSCPVVVVRGRVSNDPAGPVVVGADGSQTSAAAVRFAARYADAVGAPLHAVCAAPDPSHLVAPDLIVTDEYRAQLHAEADRFVHESLAGICQDYPELVVDTFISDRPASPALTEAGESAQLVVVGTHGRGGFAGMLLGSTSRAVLFHAPCPIAVVRDSPR